MKEDGSEYNLIKWSTPSIEECVVNIINVCVLYTIYNDNDDAIK